MVLSRPWRWQIISPWLSKTFRDGKNPAYQYHSHSISTHQLDFVFWSKQVQHGLQMALDLTCKTQMNDARTTSLSNKMLVSTIWKGKEKERRRKERKKKKRKKKEREKKAGLHNTTWKHTLYFENKTNNPKSLTNSDFTRKLTTCNKHHVLEVKNSTSPKTHTQNPVWKHAQPSICF